jgi:hypothetical protein
MQLPQIRIERTYANIGLNIRKPVQEIEQPKAEMNLRQEPAVLTIQQPRLELSIDSSQARSNIWLMNPMQFSDSNAAYGKSQWLEAVGEMSQEGDVLMRIETKSNAVAELAVDKGVLLKSGYVPPDASFDEGVEVRFESKPAVIHVVRRGMRMDPVIHPPVHKYTPGKVEGYVRQWPKLHIEVVGLHVDRSL